MMMAYNYFCIIIIYNTMSCIKLFLGSLVIIYLFYFIAFAINTNLILKLKNVTINAYSRIGWVESDFLSQIISPQEVNGGADNCTKVTKTQ